MTDYKKNFKIFLNQMLELALENNLAKFKEKNKEFSLLRTEFFKPYGISTKGAEELDLARNEIVNIFQFRGTYGENSPQYKRSVELSYQLIREAEKYVEKVLQGKH